MQQGDRLVGSELGRYRLEERIGSGRLGDVYRATQVGLDRMVAVKVMPPEKAADPQLARRFRIQGQALAKLSHPNVLTIFDSGVVDGYAYYVMELLAPEDLEAKLRSGALPLEEALSIATEVAKALAFMHEKTIVHGALFPAAVRFGTRGSAVLADIGSQELAKAPGNALRLSPEQALGEAVGSASDVYQLGALVYEMVTGQLPHPGTLPFVVGGSGDEARIRPASSLQPKATAELDRFLVRLLATASDARPSASEAFKELQKLQRRQQIRGLATGTSSGSAATTSSGPLRTVPMGPTRTDATRTLEAPAEAPAWYQSPALVRALATLTGGHGNLAERETQVRLLAVLGPVFLLVLLAALAARGRGVFAAAPRLVEHSKQATSRGATFAWRLDRPGWVFVEVRPSGGGDAVIGTPVDGPVTEGRTPVEGLAPSSRYLYRLGVASSADPSGASFGAEYPLETSAGIEFREVRLVKREEDRATIRWTTTSESDTRMRIEEPSGAVWLVENAEQERERDHLLVLRGLKPDTVYRFRLLARDPSDPSRDFTGEESSFQTASPDPGVKRRPWADLAGLYLGKLQRLEPRARAELESALYEALPSLKTLTKERKQEIASGRTTPETFPTRRRSLAQWVEQLVALGVALPTVEGGRRLDEEASYLRSLFEVSPDRAVARLDQALQAAWAAEGG